MGKLFLVVVAFLLCSLSFAYQLNRTRDQILTSYYSEIDSKIPNGLRALIGDERINAYIGGKTIGIETKSGKLYSFEFEPVKNPGIIIYINDAAADGIGKGQLGVIKAIDNGWITIKTTNFFSYFKVEALKRIYAASGMDEKIIGTQKGASSYNSIYVQKLKVSG